jgi:hypothetical protein
MKQNLKPFLIGFTCAVILSSIAGYFGYLRMKEEFTIDLKLQSFPKTQVTSDSFESYKTGYMDCLRELNSNVYSAYLTTFIDGFNENTSDEEFKKLADHYELNENQLEYIKKMVR